MPARGWCVLWMLFVTGCATSRTVRLDTGEGRAREYTPRTDTRPVALEGDTFEKAVRMLAREAPVSLRLSNPGAQRPRASLGVVSVDDPKQGRVRVAQGSTELEAAYGRWCVRKRLSGDCLHLLDRGLTLDEEGKRTLAFRIALDSVWEETAEALEGMVDPEATVSLLVMTGAVYFSLWLVPEPLLSKGVAATLTVALIAYLGWDTVWSLIQGWRVLAAEVKEAETFDGIRDAGEKYGEVMGKQAARAFVMLAMAALGSTAQTLSARVATLPGSAQAALVGAEQGGFRLVAAAEVSAVAVSASGEVTIALSPNAVAMSAKGPNVPVPVEVRVHHIATNKWWEATHNGGPWSPQFQRIFDRAGMSLDDPANKVRVPGHKGPHPEAYHQRVHSRLNEAMEDCGSIHQCREALTNELRRLASDILNTSTTLNKWVTKS
ncbi:MULTISPECIES: AHH domain-containing protein [unclassified Corallococcus]|uniref:AHH domain-containing protein n=1 Tax=unclassified Corallococcus TaxID=2685029 RepID=UPI001A8E267A|nr:MULTISPECIES: AHH domain-containing protein [unclassified Corallococcus]MBN9681156.1 AHH domain-containing protein [Corallococcus sp. NCSPR001]WAS87263.1 AHH domain-containing protein [Corallococcus sp. NCRR]